MSSGGLQMSLGTALRVALDQRLPDGSLYLPQEENLRSDTPCLFLRSGDGGVETDYRTIPLAATDQGFPFDGLDSPTIQDITKGARCLVATPTDAILLRAYCYYLKFDVFLPSIDASDPPSVEESTRRLDYEFYHSLGSERAGTACQANGCRRGAISQSVLCKTHHFESIKRKPCPFVD